MRRYCYASLKGHNGEAEDIIEKAFFLLWKKMTEEKSMEFTLEEIEQLMDDEVAKPEEEMDTELVDMCASILAKAYNPDFKDEKPTEMFRPW